MSTSLTCRDCIGGANLSLNEKNHLGGDLILKYAHNVCPNVRLSCVRRRRAMGSREI